MFTASGIDRSNVEVFCRGRWFTFPEILPTAHLIELDKRNLLASCPGTAEQWQIVAWGKRLTSNTSFRATPG